jgi:hypothetical protein
VAATRTRSIRSAVRHPRDPKEPTILAHDRDLDELPNARGVYSVGNIAMLEQYHVDWKAAPDQACMRPTT